MRQNKYFTKCKVIIVRGAQKVCSRLKMSLETYLLQTITIIQNSLKRKYK